MERVYWVALSFLVGVVFWPRVADGAPVRFVLSGTLTIVNDPLGVLPSDVYEGAPFAVRLSYDLDAADTLPSDGHRGGYLMQPCGTTPEFIVTIGSQNLACGSNGGFSLQVENDVQAPPFYPPDAGPAGDYFFAEGGAAGLELPAWNMRLGIRLDDLTSTVFSSDDLPQLLSADWFDDRQFFASGYISAGTVDDGASVPSFSVIGDVESIILVPEPGSVVLLVGLVAGIMVGASRHARSRAQH